jgi:hypothetical protein
MRKKDGSTILILCLMLILIPACHRNSPVGPKPETQSNLNQSEGIEVADTIIYEVLISNPNPDDPWAVKCLSRLNRKILIDSIFSMIYEKRAVAYNQETHEKLTAKQVRTIESAKGFHRDDIGMIQFTEAWYLNTVRNTMTKKVLSMVLGYNFYLETGELFGHKPVFRVEMRNSDK